MAEREYTLVEIVRDPGVWIYEAHELSVRGHYYIYRYDSGEQVFYRATVPAGAAAVHFFPLKAHSRVPISGWHAIEKKPQVKFRPRLVDARRPASV